MGQREKSYLNYLVSIHITILFFFRLHSDWLDQVSAKKAALVCCNFY